MRSTCRPLLDLQGRIPHDVPRSSRHKDYVKQTCAREQKFGKIAYLGSCHVIQKLIFRCSALWQLYVTTSAITPRGSSLCRMWVKNIQNFPKALPASSHSVELAQQPRKIDDYRYSLKLDDRKIPIAPAFPVDDRNVCQSPRNVLQVRSMSTLASIFSKSDRER